MKLRVRLVFFSVVGLLALVAPLIASAGVGGLAEVRTHNDRPYEGAHMGSFVSGEHELPTLCHREIGTDDVTLLLE